MAIESREAGTSLRTVLRVMHRSLGRARSQEGCVSWTHSLGCECLEEVFPLPLRPTSGAEPASYHERGISVRHLLIGERPDARASF